MEYRDFIEELLNKTDIVSLISRYTRLVKKGNDYWACCPFHNEKEPSFKIYNSTKSYHCFGCKASGNAITFLSEIESISRYDATKMLAEQAGMEMPKSAFHTNEDKEIIQKRERLYHLMRDAARYYHGNLLSDRGHEMLQYLTDRGITRKSITSFGLGASTSYDGVIEALKEKGYTLDEMKQAGIINQKADKWYDVYHDRVMFPIINIMGEVVSFSGRVLGKSDIAKYRNGAQTLIFDKSRNLYGINLAKKGKSLLDYVIIVEGHIDAVSLHQAGYVTTVASMGTALTTAQAKQLKNITSKIYISYDGDAAGQKATIRGLDILAGVGLNVRVVELPEGKDPDDIIRTEGKEFYDSLLKKALPLTAFKIKSLSESYDLDTHDGKAEFAVRAIKVIKQLENPVEQEEYLKQIQTMTDYSMAVLHRQANIEPEVQREPQPVNDNFVEKTNKKDKIIIFILACILAKERFVYADEDYSEYIPEGIYRQIYDKIKSGVSPETMYSEFDGNDVEALNAIVNYEFKEGDNKEKFDLCLSELRIMALEEKNESLAKQYEQTKDPTILTQLRTCGNMIRTIKNQRKK